MGNIDITTIANALIALVAAVITTFVIPYIKSKTTENQRKTFSEWAKIAVKAAEQIYKGSGRGPEKKKYVLDFLNSKGYKLDESSLEVTIEAAVKDIGVTFFEVESGETSAADDDKEDNDD